MFLTFFITMLDWSTFRVASRRHRDMVSSLCRVAASGLIDHSISGARSNGVAVAASSTAVRSKTPLISRSSGGSSGGKSNRDRTTRSLSTTTTNTLSLRLRSLEVIFPRLSVLEIKHVNILHPDIFGYDAISSKLMRLNINEVAQIDDRWCELYGTGSVSFASLRHLRCSKIGKLKPIVTFFLKRIS